MQVADQAPKEPAVTRNVQPQLVQARSISVRPAAISSPESKSSVVELTRDETGFGISIAGGRSSSTVDAEAPPVYIKAVRPGSVAERNGGLSVRDRVMSVNGVSVQGMAHDDIVELMKNANKITLVVEPRIKRVPGGSASETATEDAGAVSPGHLALGNAPSDSVTEGGVCSVIIIYIYIYIFICMYIYCTYMYIYIYIILSSASCLDVYCTHGPALARSPSSST